MTRKPFLIFDAGGVLVFPDFDLLAQIGNQAGISTSPGQIAQAHARLFWELDENIAIFHQFPKVSYFQEIFKQISDSEEKIKTAFANTYLDKNGSLKVTSQSAHVLALAFDLLTEKQQRNAANALAHKIAQNNFCMATGFLGTKELLPVLSRHGHHDLAVRLFQSRAFPSWGYEVVNGLWEEMVSGTVFLD